MDGESETSRGVRGKKTIPGVISRGAMCVWCRHQGPDNRRGGMGFGAWGPAECCRAGKRRGLDRKSDDNPVATPILLSTVQSFSVPLPAWQAARAGRWQRQLAGPGLVRESRLGLTQGLDGGLTVAPVEEWMQRSVVLAGKGPNGKRARRDVGGQKYLHRDPRKADLQMAMAAYGNGQWAIAWKWKWQTSRGAGTGSGLGRHLQRAGPDDPSGHRWPTGINVAACCCMDEGICGVVERRLLGTSGLSKAQIRYACADIGLPVHRSGRRRQRALPTRSWGVDDAEVVCVRGLTAVSLGGWDGSDDDDGREGLLSVFFSVDG